MVATPDRTDLGAELEPVHPGQADVERLDAQGVDHLEDGQLVVDGGVAHRRRLQAVPQGLVVEGEAVAGERGPLLLAVPVVDDVGFLHGLTRLARTHG